MTTRGARWCRRSSQAGVRRVRITGGEPLLHPAGDRAGGLRRVARRGGPGADDERDAAREARPTAARRRAAAPHRVGGLARAGALLAHHARRAARAGPCRDRGRARGRVRGAEDQHGGPARRQRRRARVDRRVGLGARHRPALHRGDARRRGGASAAREARGSRRDARHVSHTCSSTTRVSATRAAVRPSTSPRATTRGRGSASSRGPRTRTAARATGCASPRTGRCARASPRTTAWARWISAQKGDVPGLVKAIGEAWALKPDVRTWKGCTEDTAADVSMRAIGG